MSGREPSLGTFSDEVKRLQARLRQAGIDIEPAESDSGLFGPGTLQAVRQFQIRNGLPGTGILDGPTAALLQLGQAPQPARRGNNPLRIGLVLSGWAPAMTLMSGAMLGFIEKGITFDVISTSGVGTLIGLLALSPKGGSAKEALQELPNLFVSDFLYRLLPVNFKLFFRFGPFGEPMYRLRQKMPKLPCGPQDSSFFTRFVNDWIDLVFCAMTPTTFTLKSPGLMCHCPHIDDLVDFTNLRRSPSRFYLNAFDLNQKRLEIFDNEKVTTDAYHAAEALPFLFAPQRVGAGNLFTTGATHDPTGLQAIWLHEKRNLDIVVALDPLSPAIWREPTSIHDAFQLMVMNPILALEELLFAFYARTDQVAESLGKPEARLPRLYRLPFAIDRRYYPEMLKWNHSNAIELQRVGREAAIKFADDLQAGVDEGFEQEYRFYRWVEKQQRIRNLMRLFPSLRAPQAEAVGNEPVRRGLRAAAVK